MNNKTTAIVSYITIIGWLIAFFTGERPRNSLAKYHLNQGFGLFIAGLILGIIVNILAVILPSVGVMLSSILGIALVLLLIIGAINAGNEKEAPLPIIGKFFENKFSFID